MTIYVTMKVPVTSEYHVVEESYVQPSSGYSAPSSGYSAPGSGGHARTADSEVRRLGL